MVSILSLDLILGKKKKKNFEEWYSLKWEEMGHSVPSVLQPISSALCPVLAIQARCLDPVEYHRN